MRSHVLTAEVLQLDARHEIAAGYKRRVYEHEALPGVLIKVLRPELLDEDGNYRSASRWKKMRPLGAYAEHLREFTETLAQHSLGHTRNSGRLPIAQTYGVVMTSLGLGLVVEKIAAADGRLAPTLHSILDAGVFDAGHLAGIDRFADRCRALHVVLGDVHPGNLVLAQDSGDASEFVCVDGFGESRGIPVHRWSARLNARKVDRHRARLLEKIRARWPGAIETARARPAASAGA